MKNILLVFVVIIMMLSFVACGDGKSNNTTPTTSSNTNQTTNNNKNNEYSIDETVVIDNSDCLIKITDIYDDNIWGFTIKVELENRSADKKYMFTIDTASINGVVCDPLFASEVAAGKKANDKITFYTDTLDENNIGDYTDIELAFRVYDSDDWMSDDIAYETVHIYPLGEDKAINYVRESKPTDNVIIDNEYITAIVTGYTQDDFFGYTVNYYFINKTDKNIMISADDVSVNDIMLDPLYATTIPAGKCAFSDMSWFDDEFMDNAITDVEKIEFIFSVSDYDDWLADDYVNESITLNP
ncbi:MAG: hypothetical protein IKY44_06160 [Clostridia bacterium]|nr:hypothetical protein [Clostridia bacterium]